MKLLLLFSLFSLTFTLTLGQSYGFTPYFGLGINPLTSPLYGYGLGYGYGGYGYGYGGYGRYPYFGSYGYYPYISRSQSESGQQNTLKSK